MTDQDVLEYVKKCTAIILKTMEQLSVKLDRIYSRIDEDINSANKLFYRTSKEWDQHMDKLDETEARIEKELRGVRAEFDDALRRLR